MSLHTHTQIVDSPWTRMSGKTRLAFNKGWALAHLMMLVLGTQNPVFWQVALALVVLDTASTLALVKFRPLTFPAQVRFIYAAMLFTALGVPGLSFMVYPMAAGFVSFLVFDICPMARSVGRLPWNRPQVAPAAAK